MTTNTQYTHLSETTTYLDGSPVQRDADGNIISQPARLFYPDGVLLRYNEDGSIVDRSAELDAFRSRVYANALRESARAPEFMRGNIARGIVRSVLKGILS